MNETEWARQDNLKKIFATIQRQLVEDVYPREAEVFVKRQI